MYKGKVENCFVLRKYKKNLYLRRGMYLLFTRNCV